MSDSLDSLIAQLEGYSQRARQQIDTDTDQIPYWRGVLFGVELALLEARKRKSGPMPSSNFSEVVSKLVGHLTRCLAFTRNWTAGGCRRSANRMAL
ncbi:MAG: hypothetical protein ACYDEO_28885 [Aggregatilineales bacterium]